MRFPDRQHGRDGARPSERACGSAALWYLSDPDWPSPNLTMLNNALQQTGWTGDPLTDCNWRRAIRDRLHTMAWERVVADVRPFLEPGANPDLLTPENVMRVLE